MLLPIPPPSRSSSADEVEGGVVGGTVHAEAAPPPPMLTATMLVDRTSFDETEDYGVDWEALQGTEWGKEQHMLLTEGTAGGPAPILYVRNGKVRRRLRWRPKSMLKKKRKPPLPRGNSPHHQTGGQHRRGSAHLLSASAEGIRGGQRRPRASSETEVTLTTIQSGQLLKPDRGTPIHASYDICDGGGGSEEEEWSVSVASSSLSPMSTNGSVMSEQSSKAPRSIHSFASIETQVKSNRTTTKRSPYYFSNKKDDSNMRQLRRFPLPRPGGSATGTTDINSTAIEFAEADRSSIGGSHPDVHQADSVAMETRKQQLEDDAKSHPDSDAGGQQSEKSWPTIRRSDSAPLTDASAPLPYQEEVEQAKSTAEANNNNKRPELPPKARGSSLLTPDKARSKPALPPLVKKAIAIGGGGRRRANSASCAAERNDPQQPGKQQKSSKTPKSRSKPAGSPVSVPPRFQSTPVNRGINSNQSDDVSERGLEQQYDNGPLPELCGEDVERDRVVDLRVRVPAARRALSLGTPRYPLDQQKTTDDGLRDTRTPLTVAELRASSFSEAKTNSSAFEAANTVASLRQIPTTESDRASNSKDSGHRNLSSILRPANSSPPDFVSSGMHYISPLPSEAGDESDRPATGSEELRYSLESRNNGGIDKFTDTRQTPTTVPVDLDDCCFLEAEKNLQAIHDMAAEHMRQGEYNEALEVFEEILRGQLARYGKEHYRVGTALHNIGIVHMKRRDYENAINAYREAVAIRKMALGPENPVVAASLAQLGVAYLERKMHNNAISTLREALRIRRLNLGPSHPKIAKILNNIGW